MSSLQEEHFTTIQRYVIFLRFPQWTQWLLHTCIVKQMEEVFLLVRMGFAWKKWLFLQVDWLQKTVEANLFSFQSPQGELWPELWPTCLSILAPAKLKANNLSMVNFYITCSITWAWLGQILKDDFKILKILKRNFQPPVRGAVIVVYILLFVCFSDKGEVLKSLSQFFKTTP